MCGIFGIVFDQQFQIPRPAIEKVMNQLFLLSESRGKEASGLACLNNRHIAVIKYPLPANVLIRRADYKGLLQKSQEDASSRVMMGHSRLVTNGSQQVVGNNQPVIAEGIVGIHNGIITNAEALWRQHPDLHREHDIDTEVLLKLIRHYSQNEGSLIKGVRKAFSDIEGVASIALMFDEMNHFLLATNNGSLYIAKSVSSDNVIFASEYYILETLLAKKPLRKLWPDALITQIKPGQACLWDISISSFSEFSIADGCNTKEGHINYRNQRRKIDDLSSNYEIPENELDKREGPHINSSDFVDMYPQFSEAISHLKRCSKCLLPETMPFIEFDREGVCNYCSNYVKHEYQGEDELRKVLDPYRKTDGRPDCLVTFSGGRDSSFGVHFVKDVLGMNPITYTYDWGMVTDLARRNQMRICGKLGIEHILVSADIAKKRDNIRKNVSAWLRKPDLGTVPLFMAGDKQYFYHANKVAKETGCKIIVICENPFETTRFKSGFCGISPDHAGRQTYKLALLDRIKLAKYYGIQYLTNPAYINGSLLDTLGAYCSYYFISHDYVDMFQYIKWDEKQINSVLIDQYNWETAPDTTTTWRIGDGTASFYNYIYYTMAGFTENDTFRSNQIREGVISRDDALKLVERENVPRYDSIRWYCDTIGVDFVQTINLINKARKLYPF